MYLCITRQKTQTENRATQSVFVRIFQPIKIYVAEIFILHFLYNILRKIQTSKNHSSTFIVLRNNWISSKHQRNLPQKYPKQIGCAIELFLAAMVTKHSDGFCRWLLVTNGIFCLSQKTRDTKKTLLFGVNNRPSNFSRCHLC